MANMSTNIPAQSNPQQRYVKCPKCNKAHRLQGSQMLNNHYCYPPCNELVWDGKTKAAPIRPTTEMLEHEDPDLPEVIVDDPSMEIDHVKEILLSEEGPLNVGQPNPIPPDVPEGFEEIPETTINPDTNPEQ